MVAAPDIPGHRVSEVLGAGGFATVYRSLQLAVGREVAVKIDNRLLLSDRDRRRFHREVTAAGQLSGHPNVIDLYDAGTLADGRPYLVMELCPAGSLNDALHAHGPLSAAQVLDVGIRISDALAAAHQAGIFHRDIKPANILVNRFGIVGLSDFGLASILAGNGEQSVSRDALTPAYASPESFRCEEPTAAADVYSLAATLYALLAGRPPRFPADQSSPGLAEIMMLQQQPIGDVPGAPPELMSLLRRGMASNPAERPPGAAAVRDALVAIQVPQADPAARAPWVNVPLPRAGLQPAGSADDGAPLSHGTPAGATLAPDHGARQAAARFSRPASATQRMRLARNAAVGAGLVAIIAVASAVGVLVSQRGAAGSRGPEAGNVPGALGIATVTRHCPAATVPAAAAQCPAAPECWQGLVEIAGNESAASASCSASHVWETFAIAILPADARTWDYDTVSANAAVRAVCSMRVLLASRVGQARRIPQRDWQVDVLPPDQAAFENGARAYRCVAHVLGGAAPRTPQFGPRPGSGHS